jgi:hypothetical protein
VSKGITTSRVSGQSNSRTSEGVSGVVGRASTPRHGSRSESGAILILALVYIFTVGLIVAALADWATNDLTNTAHFTTARSLQYALSSVTDTAIQSIRYTPLPSTTPVTNVPTPPAGAPGYCWTPATGFTYDGLPPADFAGENVAVWCSTVENLPQATTRVVTFSACLESVTASNCASSPLLQAVVAFDDYPPGGSPLLASQCTASVNCGEGMTLENWTWATQSS